MSSDTTLQSETEPVMKGWDDDDGDTTVIFRGDSPESEVMMVGPPKEDQNGGLMDGTRWHDNSPFSGQVLALVDLLVNDVRTLKEETDSTLDAFKFELVAFRMNYRHPDGAQFKAKRMLSFNIKESSYYGLIHSLRGTLLAMALLNYAKSAFLPRIHRQIAILLSLSILSMHFNVRRVALKVYLRTATNRLEELLWQSEQLDRLVSDRLKLMRSFSLHPRGTASMSWSRRQRLRSSQLLLKSLLTTLILSFNEKLTKLLPHIEIAHLVQYLQIYRLDLQGDEFKFINLLNRPEPPVSTDAPLRPLRLHSTHRRSRSGGASLRHTSAPPSSLVDTSKDVGSAGLSRLPSSPSKLFQQLKLIRKLYVCTVLALLEADMSGGSVYSDGGAGTGSDYLGVVLRKFNLDRRLFRRPIRSTRAFLALKTAEQTVRLEQCVTCELQDEFLQLPDSEYVSGYGYLNDLGAGVGETIAEDNEDERVGQLAGKLNDLAYKLGLIELNANQLDTQQSLEGLRQDFEALQDMFASATGDDGDGDGDNDDETDNNVSDDGCDGGSVIVKRDVDAATLKERRKRRSSGLNFSLLAVESASASTVALKTGGRETTNANGKAKENDEARQDARRKLGGHECT